MRAPAVLHSMQGDVSALFDLHTSCGVAGDIIYVCIYIYIYIYVYVYLSSLTAYRKGFASLAACRKKTKSSFPLWFLGHYRLGSAVLATLAANRNYTLSCSVSPAYVFNVCLSSAALANLIFRQAVTKSIPPSDL